MRVLLDTQVLLWFLADSPRLPRAARVLIEDAKEVFISAASVWEASIKIGAGKLSVRREDLLSGIQGSGFTPLPVKIDHAAYVATLPHHHRDPFDRMLVTQAILETLRLLTADEFLSRYSELVVQVRQ